MRDAALAAVAHEVGDVLRARHETVSVAESSAGGLIAASLLSVPGASSYFIGGTVIYTKIARDVLLQGRTPPPSARQAETEGFARYLAETSARNLATAWAIGESGAAGPSGSPYGDPPGHAWVAVAGPRSDARHLLTGRADRPANMEAFALAAIGLLRDCLRLSAQ